MISMVVVFYIFLVIFAIMGSMRGWAKELMVIFSTILALAFLSVLENLTPVIREILKSNATLQFWVRMAIIVLVVFFGYQSPKFSRISQATQKRERISDILLGFVFGAVSGYFIIGSLWYYLDAANYAGLSKYVIAPNPSVPLGETAERILGMLPQAWLAKAGSPNIYIAVVLAFIFVIVVLV